MLDVNQAREILGAAPSKPKEDKGKTTKKTMIMRDQDIYSS